VKYPEQEGLFETEEWWEEYWQGMPEYISEDLTPHKTIFVYFATEEDVAAFALLVEQRISEKTKFVWYPEAEIGRFSDKRYVDES